MEQITSLDFVKMFNRIKEQEKGRKGVTRGLSEKDERNLKKILKRGFTLEEIEAAAVQMFRDPEQWAVANGKDIPTHFLRSDNFDGYFNKALNIVAEKEKKEEKKEAAKAPAIKRDNGEEIFINESRLIYSESLKRGEWIGSIFNAHVIARDFADLIDKETKSLIWANVKDTEEETKRAAKIVKISSVIEKKFSNPEREFSEGIVKEAVKRNIFEPWKK